MEESRDQEVTRIVVVGHVDHGKSTLLGRLMLDCGRVPEERIETVKKVCAGKGIAFEPAFFFDALQEEQEQGISIDTTRVNFDFDGRRFLLIDAPGHLEFLKNMTSGASEADFGVVVVDCHEGIKSQTARHLRILAVLGISEIVVAVNKLDMVNHDQSVFDRVSAEIRELAEVENLNCVEIIPISALHGENITTSCDKLDWYKGQALLPLLCATTAGRMSFKVTEEPFRMMLQDVYKFDNQRHFAGRVMAGQISVGDEIIFTPSGKLSTVESIETYASAALTTAGKGDSIALQLSEQVFVERGEVVSHKGQPPEIDTELRAKIAWLSVEGFDANRQYLLKVGTKETRCQIRFVDDNGVPSTKPVVLANGDFADVVITAHAPVAFDRAATGSVINKLVICSEYETVAAGVIDPRPARTYRKPVVDPNVVIELGYVERQAHEERHGHRATVLWLTGLSGSGKSTLAKAVQRRLFDEQARAVVLDGDNLRSGLCADLGFSPEDRSENIRRIACTARLFVDTGCVVVVACISPYAQDREVAKQIIGAEDFNEVFVFCPLEVCQDRDPKGLYKKVATGKITQLTGLGSPYQPPGNPDLRLDSSVLSVDAEVDAVIELLRARNIVGGSAAPVAAEALARGSGAAFSR